MIIAPLIVSYFFTRKDVIGFIDVIKKIPKIIASKLGIKIIETLDIPKILKAVASSDFLIFLKNQTPDKKIINGNML